MLVHCALSFLFIMRASMPSYAEIMAYHIYPDASCGIEVECLTLSDVMKNGDKYFASNTTLFFHASNHILQGDLSAYNISKFTLQGNTTNSTSQPIPMITCINSSLFFYSVSLQISAIHFNGCSIHLSNTNAIVLNSRFANGTASYGGALALFSSKLSLRGSNTFIGNIAVVNLGYGGAIYANHSHLTLQGLSEFTRNQGLTGGALCAVEGSSVSFNGTNIFVNNVAIEGGAVAATNGDSWNFSSTLNGNKLFFSGNNSFTNNNARYGGALFLAQGSTLNMNQDTSFVRNTAEIGAAVCAWGSSTLRLHGNSSFMNNLASYDGGAVYGLGRNTFVFDGNTTFVSNSASHEGGAIDILDENSLKIIGTSSFLNNEALHDGGAMHALKDNKVNFIGNCTIIGSKATQGAGILIASNSEITVNGSLELLLNTAVFGGGIASKDSTIVCTGNLEVSGNTGSNGGGLYLQASSITAQGVGWFDGNTASHDGYGGAVFALGSTVEFEGEIQIANNTAGYGGGLALLGINDKALMFLLKAETHLNIIGNSAHKRGGAIYVEDNPFTFCTFDKKAQAFLQETCFLHLIDEWYNCDLSLRNQLYIPVNITFANNTASHSGNILYGGYLELCFICAGPDSYFGLGSEIITSITTPVTDVLSQISSDPYKVCLCENDQPQCDESDTSFSVTVYPGQVLSISVVAVGQMNGMVPSVIRAVTAGLSNNSELRITQPAENPKSCSELQYPLSSTRQEASLSLYSDEPCSTSGYPVILSITFHPCPVGFILSEQGHCICAERLQKYTQNCSIQTLTISRNQDDTFWVGTEEMGLVLHPHCPFDYCLNELLSFPLNNTDMQCANARSGVLCGACQFGHSLALGSSRCLCGCSNEYFALMLVFALAGVVLVVFLFLCRLTIAEGTLSGLIFYANVIAVNQTLFFPAGERNILTVFIAWLNLDLGIETCFVENLNVYYSTWLQFVFPIYIWLMVGVVIVLADRSTFFARMIGSTNPVAVLATLFLLSYTKLLRAIATAFSFTILDYPGDKRKFVWLYDGNIGYLDTHDARHISLFLFSLLFFLFAFLPYTLLLLCGQWIQRKLWWLSPTKQLYIRSFLDSHYAPYKKKHCYWTGLLLVLRFFMLFITTFINIRRPQAPFSNLLVLLVVVSCLTLWGWVIWGLYKKWYLDLLEVSFILNLLVLVGGTYQVRLSGGNQGALVYTSVGVVLVTFAGMIVNNVVKLVRKKMMQYQQRRVLQTIGNSNPSQTENEDSLQLVQAAVPLSNVIYSVLEIDTNETSGEIKLRPALNATAENQGL